MAELLVVMVPCSECSRRRAIRMHYESTLATALLTRCVGCANAVKNAAEAAARRTVCRHCTKCKVWRPRGLCWGCYYTPGVKELYPSDSKYARRGVANDGGSRPLPVPTATAPGTEDRIRVLGARAAAGEALWHPADARFEGDPGLPAGFGGYTFKG